MMSWIRDVLFDTFVAPETAAEEIAAMDAETVTAQIASARDAEPDAFLMTDREIANEIIAHAKGEN